MSVKVGSIRIGPGDIAFGDLDGVCTTPRTADGDGSAAIERARGEKTVEKALGNGMTAREVFGTYGVF